MDVKFDVSDLYRAVTFVSADFVFHFNLHVVKTTRKPAHCQGDSVTFFKKDFRAVGTELASQPLA